MHRSSLCIAQLVTCPHPTPQPLQVRTTDKKCSESKFFKIQEACQGPRDLAAYGIDPVFKRGTQLFNPDFDDLNQDAIQEYYNCKEIKNPTYNVTLDDGRLVNVQTNVGTETERNFCAELFSSQTLPYAFHHRNLTDKVGGRVFACVQACFECQCKVHALSPSIPPSCLFPYARVSVCSVCVYKI